MARKFGQFEPMKTELMDKVKQHLETIDCDVLQTKSNTFAIPMVGNDDNKTEFYITIVFSIPSGSRDGTLYDGYEEAEQYETSKVKKKKGIL
jgi:hypothetical protein